MPNYSAVEMFLLSASSTHRLMRNKLGNCRPTKRPARRLSWLGTANTPANRPCGVVRFQPEDQKASQRSSKRASARGAHALD